MWHSMEEENLVHAPNGLLKYYFKLCFYQNVYRNILYIFV